MTIRYMRYHKPKKELCGSDEEYEVWCNVYNKELEKRKKPVGGSEDEIRRYEKRKEVNSRACKKYYNKRRLG